MITKQHGLDLTEGKISTLLLRFATPFVLANLTNALHGMFAMIIVGQFTDAATIAGVATGTQIMHLSFPIVMGLATGGTVIIGRSMGERNSEAGTRATGTFFAITGMLTVLITLLLLFLRAPLLTALGTQEDMWESANRFVMISALGVPFTAGFAMFGAVFRGIGNSKAPSIAAAISAGVNIALSFLLTGVLGMAETGVALATVTANFVSCAILLVWLYKRKLPYPFAPRKDVRLDSAYSKYITIVGLPLVMQDIFITISFMIITNRVNNISTEAAASVGVVARAFMVAFVIPAGIGQAVSAMTAQNLGANMRDRAISSLRWGIIYALMISTVIFAICMITPETVTRIFSNDEVVISGAASYLRTFSADALMVSFVFCMNAYFSGCGKTNIAMVHSLISTFAIRVPLSIYFAGLQGLDMNTQLSYLGIAAPSASMLSLVICSVYLVMQGRKYRASLAQ